MILYLPFHPGTGLPVVPGGGSKSIPRPAQVDVIAQPVSLRRKKKEINYCLIKKKVYWANISRHAHYFKDAMTYTAISII